MDHTLTKLPLENSKGEPLKICSDCFGGGIARASRDDYVMATGRTFMAGQPITEQDVRTFNKKNWKYSSKVCETCGGAGMAKVLS